VLTFSSQCLFQLETGEVKENKGPVSVNCRPVRSAELLHAMKYGVRDCMKRMLE